MTEKLLTLREVCELRGRSSSSLYRDIEKGLFPRPVKIAGSARWPASDLDRERERLVAERDAGAAPGEPVEPVDDAKPARKGRPRAARSAGAAA